MNRVTVLIPARDEELLLPRCLRSVRNACAWVELAGVTTDIVLVADSCRDRTRDVARELMGRSGTVIETDVRCVGAARAVAARAALERAHCAPERCWLANTDADSEVPFDWLAKQLALAARGVHAVAGVVDVDDFSEHDENVPERFRLTYLVNRDGTHPHVHGANLGVRADAYLRAGGWSPLTHSEDHDLWRRLRANGETLVSDAEVKVVTSGRRQSRAPHGFADALAAHNAE